MKSSSKPDAADPCGHPVLWARISEKALAIAGGVLEGVLSEI